MKKNIYVILFSTIVTTFCYIYFFSDSKLKILTVENKFYNSSYALVYFNKIPANIVLADGMNTNPTTGKITVNLINNNGCDADVIMASDGLPDNEIKSGLTYTSYVGSNQTVLNSAMYAANNYVAIVVCDYHSSSTDYNIEYQIQDQIYYASGHLSYKMK